MSTMAPMLLAMFCAASCTLMDRCRTVAGASCACVMLFAMLDAAYLHLIPSLLSVALIVGAGIWAAFGEAHKRSLSLQVFQILSSVVMGLLVFHHTEVMRLLGEVCTTNILGLNAQFRPNALASVGAAVLFAGGVTLSAAMLIGAGYSYGVRQRLVMLEPAFMGLSLILML